MQEKTPSPDVAVSRRDFVSALGAAWITAAMACSRADSAAAAETASAPASASASPPLAPPHDSSASQPQRLQHFSAAQGVELEAITARIIPTDDTPGAREAGVVYFIDQGMRTFAKDQAKVFDDGLAAVAKEVARKHRGETKFSALTAAQQDAILRGMERTPFFGALRFATIAGFLALPKYGGNKDYI